MDVYVYSSSAKNGYYIYLAEKDNFDAIPESIRPRLGKLSLALKIDLKQTRKLATEDPRQVLENLQKSGFHLQISDPLLAADQLGKLSGL